MDPELEAIKREISQFRKSVDAFREMHNNHERRINLLESRIRVTCDLISNTLSNMEKRFSKLTKKTNEELTDLAEFRGTLRVILLKLSILEIDYGDRKNNRERRETSPGEDENKFRDELLSGALTKKQKKSRYDNIG